MLSKNRIAVLVALLFAVPVAVAALEQAAPSGLGESVDSRAEAQPMESTAQPVATGGEQVIGTAPEGGLVRATPSDAFPKGSDVEWEIMPALARYLDEMERKRGPLFARGDSFPQGSEVEWEMLPAQIAYFDRLERQRVASAQPASQTAAPVASAAPAEESRNPLLKATDYISGLLKTDRASAPADSTAAAQ